MILGVVYWTEVIIIHQKMYTTENILRLSTVQPFQKKTHYIKFLTIGNTIYVAEDKFHGLYANVLISCSKGSGSCKPVICG